MNKIKRKYFEIFRPASLCKYEPCVPIEIMKHVRKSSYEMREIAADWEMLFTECKNCGKTMAEPKLGKKIDYYTSCSMPKDMWDDIKKQGYVIID